MAIKTVTCRVCGIEFKYPKKINKPFVGYFRDRPVFEHYYSCPNGHKHFVRYWNEYVNEYFDRVMGLEFDLIIHRKDEDKCRELMQELEIARDMLDKVREVVGIK